MNLERNATRTNSNNSTSADTEQLSVAILCHDLVAAKEISDIFKKTGVHPFVCTSLNEYADLVKGNEIPHLSVVDVRMMSEGNLLFKNIPAVKNEKLSLCFYCGKDNGNLLYSTYDILSLGVIHEERSLTGQIKAILSRYNNYQSWVSQARSAISSETKLDEKLTAVVERTEELKEQTFFHSFQKTIEARFENEKSADEFITSAARVFSTVKEFKKFTFLELSPSGQKLVSPKFIFDKYVEVPSLWLGKTCSAGIEFFAQNMASQVCLELMGGDLMSLLIKGRRDHPDLMIFIQVEGEELLSQFDWESFENFLSGIYCYFGWRNQRVEDKASNRKQAWDLYHELDDIKFGGLPESRLQGGYDRHALLGVNFSDLVDRALSQTEMRFYWKNFIQDFINGLETQKKLQFTSYQHGTRHLFLRVEKEDLDEYLTIIKNYALRFSYWRYFEDADVILGASLKPEVRVYPMSPNAIENLIDDSDIALESQLSDNGGHKEKRSEKSFFRTKGSERTM